MGSPPSAVSPHYGTSLPNPPADDGPEARKGFLNLGWFKTLNGILTIVTIIALTCVIISAGVSNRHDGYFVNSYAKSQKIKTARVDVDNTRNSVLTFAIIGLILVLADLIIHVFNLIARLPAQTERIFSIVMLVFAAILLILGCCAAAWEKKMDDVSKVAKTNQTGFKLKHKGAPAAAAFFLFAAMLSIIGDHVSRLIRRQDPP
ncbi:unnamed protein product, partial [Didymodactylos carnosus]